MEIDEDLIDDGRARGCGPFFSRIRLRAALYLAGAVRIIVGSGWIWLDLVGSASLHSGNMVEKVLLSHKTGAFHKKEKRAEVVTSVTIFEGRPHFMKHFGRFVSGIRSKGRSV